MQEVGLIGAGPRLEMLARLLSLQGHKAVVWQVKELGTIRRGTPVTRVKSVSELAQRVRLVVVAVPPWMMQSVAQSLGPCLHGGHRVVHTAQGMDLDTGLRGSEILLQETPVRQVGVLAGALMPPDEVGTTPGAALVSSRFPLLIEQAQALLSSPMYRVYGSLDLEGVEVASAAACVVSVAVGMLHGLSLGAAARGMLMARGVAEISRVVEIAGGKPRTGAGMAGLGLLVAHTTAPGGVEFALGRALAEGGTHDSLLESYGAPMRELVSTSALLSSMVDDAGQDAFIIKAMHQVLTGQESVMEVVRGVLSLAQMME